MSIPPLVCSTPPPPDQCEDDKDLEDFDLQYNLSQDDDSNEYDDHGGFSACTHYQPSISENVKASNLLTNESKPNEGKIHIGLESVENKDDIVKLRSTIEETKSKYEEDINIEDLNLKVDDEPIDTVSDVLSRIELDSKRIDISSHVDLTHDDTNYVSDHHNTSESPSLEEHSAALSENILEQSDEAVNIEHNSYITDNYEDSIELSTIPLSVSPNKNQTLAETYDAKNLQKADAKDESNIDKTADDEFGNFDEFQFTESSTKSNAVIEICVNPWDNNNTEESGFGEFKANFDDEAIVMKPNDVTDVQLEQCQNKDESKTNDFGDFDDFKSSTASESESYEPSLASEIPVLNLQLTEDESHRIESIQKVLNLIFDNELEPPKSEFDGKFESLLSETWGHLVETDVRQPYMVNWNNSLGQKTLLKALCIDSRNILFGPKWSYNMPKYAVNLNAAPLQPQKQSTQSLSQLESPGVPKSSKASGSWADSFTSDTPESCSTENKKSTVEIRPADLNLLEGSAKKGVQIFSSTLSVQPLRQINLPDTHIFTPTDSETPRSKTIHYGPTVVLPQAILEENRLPATPAPQFEVTGSGNYEIENEYTDFQDFKGTSDVNAYMFDKVEPTQLSQKSEDTSSQKYGTYRLEILQPIKVEPIMPTLNWPDPGEVKDIFDDFADFISSSSIVGEKKSELQASDIPEKENRFNIELNETISSNQAGGTGITVDAIKNESFADEFDTFQSASPAKALSSDYDSNNINNYAILNSQSVNVQSSLDKSNHFNVQQPIFDKTTDKFENMSSLNVSSHPDILSKNMAVPNFETCKVNLHNSVKSLPPSGTGVQGHMNSPLKPLPASSTTSSSTQKSSQILQPLSLESYSQINWPNPGIDLQDLSRFNPVESLHSFKSELNAKVGSPVHNQATVPASADDDIWGEFVSSKPKQQPALQKKGAPEDDEWTDFVSSPSMKPQNGLNTISFNVHSNSNKQKPLNSSNSSVESNQLRLDIPTLNYVTPKSSNHKSYNDRHFQNL